MVGKLILFLLMGVEINTFFASRFDLVIFCFLDLPFQGVFSWRAKKLLLIL
jgi:hypothetical protein